VAREKGKGERGKGKKKRGKGKGEREKGKRKFTISPLHKKAQESTRKHPLHSCLSPSPPLSSL
jgi:hypothetical protein